MSENKYSFRNEIKFGLQKEKEARALKDFKRNRIGLYFSAVVFFIVLLTTLGGDGSIYCGKGERIRQQVYKVQAVDTTAAGDTFTGFFIGAVSKGASAADAIRRASAASAIAVSRPGAAPSVPTADEVDAFLACNTPCTAPEI